jgi:hypothetical protein
MQERTCYIKGVSTIGSNIKSMPTPKVNTWFGAPNLSVNSSLVPKPKPSMDISVALHCSYPALDHT